MRIVPLFLLAASLCLGQSLNGVIDVHAHVDPETIPRSIDAITLAQMARQEGMRAVVFKNHFFPTQGIAFLVHRVVPGIDVFGGIALNRAVGGVNPVAVQQMVDLPGRFGRIVWMPTMDSEYGARNSPNRPFVAVAKNGVLLPDVIEVFKIIAREDIALATGHSSPEENLLLIREARKLGVKRIIVTHPTSGVDIMSLDQQKQAAAMGAFLEYCYVGTLPFAGAGRKTMAFYAQNMKALGAEHVIMSSDLGNAVNPVHTAGMRSYIQDLLKEGISQADIDQMVRKNPAFLLDLK